MPEGKKSALLPYEYRTRTLPVSLGTYRNTGTVQYEMVRCRQTCLPYATLLGNRGIERDINKGDQ